MPFKTTTLISLIFLFLPVGAQEEQPPAKPPKTIENPLTAKPARDLFDLATLQYNSATSEKDPARQKQACTSAAKTFDNLLRTYPKNSKAIESWYFLGLSYRKIDQPDASKKCFSTIATRWRTGKYVEAAALYLASDSFNSKQWAEASKWFQIVAQQTKKPKIRHESLYRRYLCAKNLKNKVRTQLALKDILADKENPFQEIARLALARLYRDKKSYRLAFKQFAQLAKETKKPDYKSEATLQAALMAQKLKSRKTSKTWFKKSLEDPGLTELRGKTQLTLMNLHFRDREWQSVVDTYKEFKTRQTHFNAIQIRRSGTKTNISNSTNKLPKVIQAPQLASTLPTDSSSETTLSPLTNSPAQPKTSSEPMAKKKNKTPKSTPPAFFSPNTTTIKKTTTKPSNNTATLTLSSSTKKISSPFATTLPNRNSPLKTPTDHSPPSPLSSNNSPPPSKLLTCDSNEPNSSLPSNAPKKHSLITELSYSQTLSKTTKNSGAPSSSVLPIPIAKVKTGKTSPQSNQDYSPSPISISKQKPLPTSGSAGIITDSTTSPQPFLISKMLEPSTPKPTPLK